MRRPCIDLWNAYSHADDHIPRLLANLMLPDGAERQTEDWTIFFLNQRPFNTIAPVLALESTEPRTEEADVHDEGDSPELIYVLNLVRTKLDNTVRRYVERVPCQSTTSIPHQRSDSQSDGYMHSTFVHRDLQGTTQSRSLRFADGRPIASLIDGTG